MGVLEFIIGFFIALFVAVIVFYGFRRRGPWNAFWIFLLFLVLVAWAGRLWVTPVGPEFWGFGWLSVVFWVFIFALLIAAATPDEPRTSTEYEVERTDTTSDEVETAAAFGFLFWLLLLLLVIAVIAGLFW